MLAYLRHPRLGVLRHVKQLAKHISTLVSGSLPGIITLRVEVASVAGSGFQGVTSFVDG
jgi:hypothetical protein